MAAQLAVVAMSSLAQVEEPFTRERCARAPSRDALFHAEARIVWLSACGNGVDRLREAGEAVGADEQKSVCFTIVIADQPDEIGKILGDLESVLEAADVHR